jgi:hypothetical protein
VTGARSGVRRFLVAFTALALMSIAWALAGPVFSAPDENAHAAKAIATVRGELFGEREPDAEYLVVQLPDGFAYHPQQLCFIRDASVPAECGVALGDEGGLTEFPSWVAAYNPSYYLMVGWPTFFWQGDAGVYAMRICSGLIASALLAAAAALAFASTRRLWAAGPVAFLAAPMVVYLGASVSPQGLEVAAGALLWVGMLRLLESWTDEPPAVGRTTLWVLVVTAASLLAVARAIGPFWVVVIVASTAAIVGWRAFVTLLRTRISYVWMSIVAAVGIFSVVWTLAGGSLSGQAEASDAPLVGGSFIQGFWLMVRSSTRYAQEAAGVFGWLDTPLPVIAYALWFGCALLLAVLAFAAADRRGRVIVVAALAAVVVIPAFVQAASVARSGIIWQGRYGLVLVLGALIVIGWVLGNRTGGAVDGLARPVLLIVVGLLAVFHVTAFATVLRRYMVGDGTFNDMVRAPVWQPPLGWLPLAAIAVLGVAVMAAWLLREVTVAPRMPAAVVR